MNGKMLMVWPLMAAMGIGNAWAEGDGPVPETPTAFETRNEGGGEKGSVSIRKKEVKSTKVTFTAVTDVREWRDEKGVVIHARLIAFETGEVVPDGKPLTLIKEERVRLLVEGRKLVSEFPMSRLSPEDQNFVKELDALKKKEAAAKAASGE